MPEPAFYLVVDLEATCDDGGRMPREEMEIIEIGAVLVDAATLTPVDRFQTFVRPVRHPRLTPFCTGLTSITQADVDPAPAFPVAMQRLTRWIGGRDALFCSWGDYDRDQFARDARRHGVTLPFGARHLNLKRAFGERIGERRGPGTGQALRRVGLRFEGTPHRGIDDACNIARLLPFSLGLAPIPE